MIQKIKKPVSILLIFMMIVSLFAIVPISAGAATMPWTNNITTGGEYTCPSNLTDIIAVSGGTEENPVVIDATQLATASWPIYLKSGYLIIVGNNNTVHVNRGFVHFDSNGSYSYRPTGDAHLTVKDITVDAGSQSNQHVLDSTNYNCPSIYENVTFKNWNGSSSGAVAIDNNTTHTFKNCTFEGNTGGATGGISVWSESEVIMEGCTFKNCTATNTDSTRHGGGAVWVRDNAKLTLDSCTFENCTGKYGAVGIESTASLTIKGNTTITGNSSGNLYLSTGATFNVAEDFTGTVGVTTQTAPTDSASVTLASGLADTQAALANKNIVSDNENYGVIYKDNSLLLINSKVYTVTWKNGDTTLETDVVEEGTTPTYNSATPTKAEDETYTYTFSGWTPEVAPVTADITYTATFTATEKVVEPPIVSYKTATWNGSEVVIDTANTNNYTVVTSETTSWSNGTYVVDADVTIAGRIGVDGNVNLILCDDATLTATQGIHVSRGNTLNIFAQSFGDSAGALNVTSGGGPHAGIGSNYNENCGNISINGGNLQVVGGNMSAGIGGGNLKAGGTITINAGDVTATGGHPDNAYGNPHGGAGIGGGSNGSGGAGNVAIHGGHVKATATGNNSPAAVGGGYARGDQGTVTITDGLVVLAGSNASSAKPCFDYPTHRTIYVEIWEHDHSELSYTTSGNVLTAECSSDGCNFINHELSVKLNTPNKSYDETAYSEAYFSSDSVAHNAAEEFNAATGLNISLDNIEYYQDGTKLPSAPIEVGNYTAKLTVVVNGSEHTISDDFKILEAHIHDGINFKFWEKTDSLPTAAGNYVLTSDVTLSGTWTVPTGETNLCLNGKTISANGGNFAVITINNGNTLNLYDPEGGGTITGANRNANGGGVSITSNGRFFMYGGTITGNSAGNAYGGGVCVDNGYFEMTGGAITNNSASFGGGVDVRNCNAAGKGFVFGGTAIMSGNTCTRDGGGVNIGGSGVMSITGGKITGNTAGGTNADNRSGGIAFRDGGTSLSISGSANISGNTRGDVLLYANKRITVSGELSDDADIGVTMRSLGVFTNSTNTDYNDLSKFTSNNTAYVVDKNGSNQLFLHTPYTVTWKNYDGTVLKTDTSFTYGMIPVYDGETPTKAEDENYTYTFSGWDPEIAAVTGDATYTATFDATAKVKDLFPQHSISLGGNVGVNFYIDSAAADFDSAETAVVKFTWDDGSYNTEVNLKDGNHPLDADGYYKATVDVVAAQMAHKIHAEVYLDGVKLDQTDDYSVQEYAETVYADPAAYDTKGKPDELKALVKALLNYGANAQTVFDSALTEKPELANATVGENGYSEVTAEQIAAAINDEASDLNDVATQLGAKYYTNSLIYLSRNTLRIYFTPTSYPGEMPNAGEYNGSLSDYYYYVDHANIPAAELDNQQTFTIGGVTFTFSALDYAKAVVNSSMSADQKNLAKSLYLYNQAANDYFDPAPAPAYTYTAGQTVGYRKLAVGDILESGTVIDSWVDGVPYDFMLFLNNSSVGSFAAFGGESSYTTTEDVKVSQADILHKTIWLESYTPNN